MFTRTLAVGLGEVRQPPSSTQCLRAASTAGALLAGYFPHLRGAFQFPQHLAGESELSVQPKYAPQIASLISAQEVPEHDACQVAHKDASADMDAVRTSVVATLMAREYGPRIHWLEGKYMELRASNQQLQSSSDSLQTRFEKTRELNRRLCREVNEARAQRTSAVEELEKSREQMQEASQVAEQLRLENSNLREALAASEKRVLELSRVKAKAAKAQKAADKKRERAEAGPDPMLLVPTSQEQCSTEGIDQIADVPCMCSNPLTWGCPAHRTYSDSLLLAHRSMAQRIALGPPGLEPESPPGLNKPEFPPGLATWDNKISLRPRPDM